MPGCRPDNEGSIPFERAMVEDSEHEWQCARLVSEKVWVRAPSCPPVFWACRSEADRFLGMEEAAGSNPAEPSMFGIASASGSVRGLYPRGHGSSPWRCSKIVRCGVAEARRGERPAVNRLFAGSNPVSHPGADGKERPIWRPRSGEQTTGTASGRQGASGTARTVSTPSPRSLSVGRVFAIG